MARAPILPFERIALAAGLMISLAACGGVVTPATDGSSPDAGSGRAGDDAGDDGGQSGDDAGQFGTDAGQPGADGGQLDPCGRATLQNLPHTSGNLVEYAFCLMLGRPSDSSGQQTYQEALLAETLLPREILLEMYQSPEFQSGNSVAALSNEAFVALLYDRLLWRQGDPGGTATQVAALNAGQSRARIFLNFVEADEFAATHPILFDDGGIEHALDSLWNGAASFRTLVDMQIATQVTGGGSFITGMNAGTHITARDGVWYLFNREYFWKPAPPQCPADFARIVVRSSTDHGLTWSMETVVAEPDIAAGECAVVDGRPYFDVQANTWHYLAQVLIPGKGWGLNHYTRSGPDPIGPFASDSHNPVVRGGDLWGRLCGPGKACPAGTVDEGTPEISFKRGGFFYVTFHGAKTTPGSSLIWGYRGVAKTADFQTWVTSDADLSGEILFGPPDCQGWDIPWSPGTGCIGSGNASTLRSYRHTYQLIEAADLSLGIVPGQHWVNGLTRANSLATTGQWQQYPRNPLLDSGSTAAGGGITYMTLFKAGGTVYTSYWSGSVFHIAELVPTPPASQTDGTSARLATGFSVLRGFVRTCQPSDPLSTDCRSAVSRYCASQGYTAGGYGPVELGDDTVNVLCVATGGADRVTATLAELAAQVPTCGSSNLGGADCASAIHRLCSSRGYGGSGFGPLEHAGTSVVMTCLQASRATTLSSTFTALQAHQPACTSANAASAACNSAINRFCMAGGHVGGFGALEHSGDVVTLACVSP